MTAPTNTMTSTRFPVFQAVKGLPQAALMLVRNWRFWLGLATLFCGIRLNFLSQSYLQSFIDDGHTMPVLSDLILDNIPLWDIDFCSDLGALFSSIIFTAYVIHRRRYRRVPLYLLLFGVFHLVRGVFIVLTPFGQPPLFDGTDGPFGGFSKFELGVYPSGHTGISWMYAVLATDRLYRALLFFCLLVIVVALFFSRAHYSIDVLSGIFFAYAIRSFGEKHWAGMVIPDDPR